MNVEEQAWARRDLKAIQAEMEQVHALQPDFLLVSVYEVDGTMRAIAPADRSLPGRKYAFRDWYQGVTRNWKPYVSEVYRPQAAPHSTRAAMRRSGASPRTRACTLSVETRGARR